MSVQNIRSVAIVGGGASGAITLDALLAEQSFDRVIVFERRDETGGVWCFDPNPEPRPLSVPSAADPGTLDPPLAIPKNLPSWTTACNQERYENTATYSTLSTNVPESAMTFSDRPKWPVRAVPAKYVHNSVVHSYIQNYYSRHDEHIRLGATVEELRKDGDRWVLTYRQRHGSKDHWQQESFDAVVLATGHYHIPFIPYVSGLRQFQTRYPGRILHSKHYRYQSEFTGKRILLVGGRASARDLVRDLVDVCPLVLQSLRTPTEVRHPGVVYKPAITKYDTEDERIYFQDGSSEIVDIVIYCTGYQFSYPFLNTPRSTTEDFSNRVRVKGLYQHTFYIQDPTLCLVGTVIDAISFRAFEYQAIAVARLLASRIVLPSVERMWKWEKERLIETGDNRQFHTIGLRKAKEFFDLMTKIGGPSNGVGREFPVFTPEMESDIDEAIERARGRISLAQT